MQKGLIRKGLVFSVIVLFITVGVQPVFAGESITTTLDKDEDCIDCQVSNGISLLRAKILLFKVKVVTNIISSSKLGEIPEIKEKCQEIKNDINSIKPLDAPLICLILLPIVVQLGIMFWVLDFLVLTFAELELNELTNFFMTIHLMVALIGISVFALVEKYDCFDIPMESILIDKLRI